MADERLVSKPQNKSGKEIPKKLHKLMFNVEEAFKMAGARPKHDYLYKDLMCYAIELLDSDTIEDMSE